MSNVELARERIGEVTGDFFTSRWKLLEALRPGRSSFSLEIKLGENFDLVDNEEILIAWDDAEVIEARRDVREGETVVFEVSSVPRLASGELAQNLEVWVTDQLPVSVEVRRLSEAADLRDQASRAREREENEPSDFSKAIKAGLQIGAFQLSAGVVLAAALGIGYLVYLQKMKG